MSIKHFKNRAIVGQWYPIVFIDFHENYDQYDGFEVGICFGCLTLRCKEALPRDGFPGIGDVRELGR